MHTYPHKIENGEGEVLTFFGVVRHRDGDRMEVEFLAPPDVGTPMHLHHFQEEAITVVAGLGFSLPVSNRATPGQARRSS
jgi:hypothetical protein